MRKRLLFIFAPVIIILVLAAMFSGNTRLVFPEVWSSNGFNGPVEVQW